MNGSICRTSKETHISWRILLLLFSWQTVWQNRHKIDVMLLGYNHRMGGIIWRFALFGRPPTRNTPCSAIIGVNGFKWLCLLNSFPPFNSFISFANLSIRAYFTESFPTLSSWAGISVTSPQVSISGFSGFADFFTLASTLATNLNTYLSCDSDQPGPTEELQRIQPCKGNLRCKGHLRLCYLS